jgi:hypothetical protein
MTMQYDVKSTHLSTSGSIVGQPSRLKGFIVTGAAATASAITFKDGGSSGTTRLEFDVVSNTNPNAVYILIPGEGIRFFTDIYFTTSGTITGVTAFYG